MEFPIVQEGGAFDVAHTAILAAWSCLVASSEIDQYYSRENIQWSKLLSPASGLVLILDNSGVDDESCQAFEVGGTPSLPLVLTLIEGVALVKEDCANSQ